MKKGLTILTAAVAATMLFSCKTTPTSTEAKITSVKIQTGAYALCKMEHVVTVIVQGEGEFSNEVTWTTNNKDAHIENGNFKYNPDVIPSKNVEVEITATSVKDSSKKDTATITVLATESLTEPAFIKKAEEGDANRKNLGTKYNSIEARPSNDDFIYDSTIEKEEERRVPVTWADYEFADGDRTFVVLRYGSKKRNKMIPKAAQLHTAFENQYKDCASWFLFTDEERGECYGYYVYQPAILTAEEDLFISCFFQSSTGLPIYETYVKGDIWYSYLDLTPKLDQLII